MIYFYPHTYLRERQLDTVRNWRSEEVLNPEFFDTRAGQNPERGAFSQQTIAGKLKRVLPLVNIKVRPGNLPAEAIVYTWGALVSSGRFIVDLDTPWALTGYNLYAMKLYRALLKRILLSPRCIEIRCMSRACKQSLEELFGAGVANKACIHYPKIAARTKQTKTSGDFCRFLFIGSQFEIKGGAPLLRAFTRLHERFRGKCSLDLITYLPKQYEPLVSGCSGVYLYEPTFSRSQLYSRFMQKADVLIHPTYVDSFGMVALEALAHGMALIVSDVYALGEMVENGRNGFIVEPPLSIWEKTQPGKPYYSLHKIEGIIRRLDTSWYERELESLMERFIHGLQFRQNARWESLKLYGRRFTC